AVQAAARRGRGRAVGMGGSPPEDAEDNPGPRRPDTRGRGSGGGSSAETRHRISPVVPRTAAPGLQNRGSQLLLWPVGDRTLGPAGGLLGDEQKTARPRRHAVRADG